MAELPGWRGWDVAWQGGDVSGDLTRRLVLLRHAKSDWPDVPDHDRPLAKRGRRDAPVVGRWLKRRGYVPQFVLCSTARRTRETWKLAAPETGASPQVRYEARAYAATAGTLLELVRGMPDQCETALLIGHNPGISQLAVLLAEPWPDARAPQQGQSSRQNQVARQSSPRPGAPPVTGPLQRAKAGFPTAAAAVLEFEGGWSRLDPGQASMLDFAVPADMT
jgi:phosphohistidine phosphatase